MIITPEDIVISCTNLSFRHRDYLAYVAGTVKLSNEYFIVVTSLAAPNIVHLEKIEVSASHIQVCLLHTAVAL